MQIVALVAFILSFVFLAFLEPVFSVPFFAASVVINIDIAIIRILTK